MERYFYLIGARAYGVINNIRYGGSRFVTYSSERFDHLPVPIIDVFAGPGGLGEGFSRFTDKGRKTFRIRLSIEMEEHAHRTLKLRAFFRSFTKRPTADYFRLMRAECSLDQLYDAWPENHAAATREAWQATLGVTPNDDVDSRIKKALDGAKNWVLVGGPPCQAYSVAGRARNRGIDAADVKVGLYKEYLRLVAKFKPTVFVMENVRGLLSANLDGSIFQRILADLKDPSEATNLPGCPGYRIHSFVSHELARDLNNDPIHTPEDYLIKSEDYGVPQTRHRVILLGIRRDADVWPEIIRKSPTRVTCADVISDLPRIRSGLSKQQDSFDAWSKVIQSVPSHLKFSGTGPASEVYDEILRALDNIRNPRCGRGSEFIAVDRRPNFDGADWYINDQIGGVANHSSRTHIAADIQRYFFASCYAKAVATSPKLDHFPKSLLPDHRNVGVDGTQAFQDRFRVQLEKRPATTVTSHIRKDGHYFIHFDPTQCRSLTVREAARIQTFPDDYFFCGNRTQQYQQVGNAVPPLLAKRLAGVVWKIMGEMF